MASVVETSVGIQQNLLAEELSYNIGDSIAKASGLDADISIGLWPPERSGIEPHAADAPTTGGKLVNDSSNVPMENAFGKPQKLFRTQVQGRSLARLEASQDGWVCKGSSLGDDDFLL